MHRDRAPGLEPLRASMAAVARPSHRTDRGLRRLELYAGCGQSTKAGFWKTGTQVMLSELVRLGVIAAVTLAAGAASLAQTMPVEAPSPPAMQLDTLTPPAMQPEAPSRLRARDHVARREPSTFFTIPPIRPSIRRPRGAYQQGKAVAGAWRERALSQRHPDGWAATMYREVCWNPVKNRYMCPDGADYMNPASHVVVLELQNVEDGDVDCTWLTAPRSSHDTRGRPVKQPCKDRCASRCHIPMAPRSRSRSASAPWPSSRSRSPISLSSVSATASAPAKAIPISPSDSRASVQPTTTSRASPAIRPASATGSRSATRPSSRRTRAGSTKRAIGRSTRTSCAPLSSSPSRNRIAQ